MRVVFSLGLAVALRHASSSKNSKLGDGAGLEPGGLLGGLLLADRDDDGAERQGEECAPQKIGMARQRERPGHPRQDGSSARWEAGEPSGNARAFSLRNSAVPTPLELRRHPAR
jgi:hypothetical protein